MWKHFFSLLPRRCCQNIHSKRKMNSHMLLPGTEVRGMKDLDRLAFRKTVRMPWLRIDESVVGQTMKHLKRYLLKVDNLKAVQDFDADDSEDDVRYRKKVLLNPSMVTSFKDISENDRTQLEQLGVTDDNFQFEDRELTYSNWKAEEILKSVLPMEQEGMSSYSKVGHIIHLNLREHLNEYKYLIGQVLLDKVKGCKTVVNKVDIIDNTYRNFNMEILAGEDNMITEVKEHHYRFEFDFSKVYWNPRLCTEHERIIRKLNSGDTLYDVFAGVGPFAVPAAKRNCRVLANDLNPHSFKWLQHNLKLNKADARSFNKDGRDFIREDLASDLISLWREGANGRAHVTMNLPALAVEFLDSFIGLFPSETVDKLEKGQLPLFHVYSFSSFERPFDDVREKIENVLNISLHGHIEEIFPVRNVAPKKEMLRVTFVIPKEVFCRDNCEPSAKRICTGIESAV